MKRDQSNTILSILIFSIAVMLSGNVLSAAGEKATQAGLDAAIANQATINTTLEKDIAKLQAQIDKISIKKIGEVFGGGIVFYVDETGQYGLIASLSDQSSPIRWYNGINKVTGATGDGVGAGATNTAIIVAAQMADNPTGNFAAKVAADFHVQEDGLTACTDTANEICYGDWYLPSKHELNLMYLNTGQGSQYGNRGGFSDTNYWSSTEDDADSAWAQDFSNGNRPSYDKNSTNLSVRAIRAF